VGPRRRGPRPQLAKEIERELARVQWAPRLNVSAMTGRSVDKLAPPCTPRSRAGRPASDRQAQLLDRELVAQTPPPVRSGKQPKILFATQAGTRPPRFVLFTSGFLEAGYRRFVERRLREDFGFAGSPIEVSVKVREKRKG
jgi:GTP-binding protein